MTKRDTIIIAALVNAALLAVIFMVAINSNDDNVTDASEMKIPSLIEAQSTEIPLENIALNTPTQRPLESEKRDEIKSLEPKENKIPSDDDDDEDDDEEDSDEDENQSKKESSSKNSTETSSNQIEVTVKRGDSLDKIAKANGTTVKAIKEANQLKSDRLSIGQVLKVPTRTTSDKKSNKSKSKIASNESHEPQYYTLKNGDNPWKIAKQFRMKTEDLLQLNNMDEDKARNLKVGDRIRVR